MEPDTTTDTAADPEASRLAALDLLTAEAHAIAGTVDPNAKPGEPGGPPAVDMTGDIFGALELVRLGASPLMAWWPDYPRVWSDATLQAIAKSGAEICARHGWNTPEALSSWGPYLGLTVAVLPPSAATFAAIRQRRAELAAPRQQGQQLQPGAAP